MFKLLKSNADLRPWPSIFGPPTPKISTFFIFFKALRRLSPKMSPECSPATIPILIESFTYLRMPLSEDLIESIKFRTSLTLLDSIDSTFSIASFKLNPFL